MKQFKYCIFILILTFYITLVKASEPAPLAELEKTFGLASDGAYQIFTSKSVQRYWNNRGNLLATLSLDVFNEGTSSEYTNYHITINQLQRSEYLKPYYERGGNPPYLTVRASKEFNVEERQIVITEKQIKELKQVIPTFKNWEKKLMEAGETSQFIKQINDEFAINWDGKNASLMLFIETTNIDPNGPYREFATSNEVDDLSYIISQVPEMVKSIENYNHISNINENNEKNTVDNILGISSPNTTSTEKRKSEGNVITHNESENVPKITKISVDRNKNTIPDSAMIEAGSKFPKDYIGKYIYGNLILASFDPPNSNGIAYVRFYAPINKRPFVLKTRHPQYIQFYSSYPSGQSLTITRKTPLKIIGKAAFNYIVNLPYEDIPLNEY